MTKPSRCPRRRARPRSSPTAAVELSHVAFSYVPERKLIEDLNLKVEPGERVAIVGPTGCGKTTLINLLMRFYDVNSGQHKSPQVRTYATLHATSLRRSYGMVLQDTWLRADTSRNNIAYGKPERDRGRDHRCG